MLFYAEDILKYIFILRKYQNYFPDVVDTIPQYVTHCRCTVNCTNLIYSQLIRTFSVGFVYCLQILK